MTIYFTIFIHIVVVQLYVRVWIEPPSIYHTLNLNKLTTLFLLIKMWRQAWFDEDLKWGGFHVCKSDASSHINWGVPWS